MYEDYYYKGVSLKEWAEKFNYQLSLGELYRMAKDGIDFQKFLLEIQGIISGDR